MKKNVFFSYSFKHNEIIEYYFSLFSRYSAEDTNIFFYEKALYTGIWDTKLKKVLDEIEIFVFFLGKKLGDTQQKELEYWNSIKNKNKKIFILIEIENLSSQDSIRPEGFTYLVPFIDKDMPKGVLNKYQSFCKLYKYVQETEFISYDGLPSGNQIFNYEKDIIEFYTKKYVIENEIKNRDGIKKEFLQKELINIEKKLAEGIPPTWPDVKINKRLEKQRILKTDTDKKGTPNFAYALVQNPLLNKKEIGDKREEKHRVLAAALTKYHEYDLDGHASFCGNFCMKENFLTFPEAGPRENIYVPKNIPFDKHFNVAILVSGGIAPGTNALIDSITRRHFKYAKALGYHKRLQVLGLKNGFRSFDNESDRYFLYPDDSYLQKKRPSINTSEIISLGGSIIGTSRVEEFEEVGEGRIKKLLDTLSVLKSQNINTLYIIGGEGSMKAAHALYSLYEREYPKEVDWRFNVVGIPKTMDNDILWVWQTFGFMSAVEKAREFIDYLAVEVSSNPRLGIVQLFGSNSGFVVSHAVLASRSGICDFALIPESPFKLQILINELKKTIEKKNHGLIIMSETAIPIDAMIYLKKYEKEIVLTPDEFETLEKYFNIDGKKIQGHIDDKLRDASFKIVRVAIQREMDFRVLTNEPRHLIRAIPPSTVDIINASRLGILAVDNALAGYTDFMISQWLTEYCLVPLDLVVLGRKRIPKDGIFWKSVIAKTGQTENLDK